MQGFTAKTLSLSGAFLMEGPLPFSEQLIEFKQILLEFYLC